VKLCSICHIENPDDSKFCQHCGSPLLEVTGVPEDPFLGRLFLGKFRIDRVLGQGAMGKAYLAEHIVLGKKVCIKILHPHLAGDENLARRFLREARAASRLNHPNSIQISDFGTTEDGTLFIAMEYLEGVDLRRLLRKEFPLSPARVVRILGQVLSALEEAHDQSVIHRDLKPENIMVVQSKTQKDLVKVLDFGIAKIQESGVEGGTLTVAGIVCGTPEYMAPEQARGDPLDRRVDIYAAGVILYQMLTGELPFKAESALATVTKHLTEVPVPPRQRRPDLSIDPELERICLKAMEKDRERRFSSALEMKEALEAAVGQAEASGVSEVRPVPQAAASATPSGSQWAVGALAEERREPSAVSLETPLAFAVEEGSPVVRTRSHGALAAWIAAGAIVLLGGAAVILWKLEVGPFGSSSEVPRAAVAQPAVEAPVPAAPAEPTPSEPSLVAPVKAAPAGTPPVGTDPARLALDAGAAPSVVAAAPAAVEKGKPPKKKRKPGEKEDPEAALRAALAAAAAARAAGLAPLAPSPAPPPAPPPPAAAPSAPKPQVAAAPPKLPPRDPMKAQGFYEQGLQLLARNRVPEAVARLQDAVRYDPSTPEYHRDLAKAHFRNGNRKHGIWHYKRYLKLWPDAPDAATIKKIIGE
jgi:serine/threonine protein kinase